MTETELTTLVVKHSQPGERLDRWLQHLRGDLGFDGRKPSGFRAGSIPVGRPA